MSDPCHPESSTREAGGGGARARSSSRTPRFFTRVAALALAGLAFFACGERQGAPQVGSETHFLNTCEDGCGDGTECECGACTQSCSTNADCAGVSAHATCVALAPRVAEGRCDASEPQSVCDVGCVADADCAALGRDYRCEQGFCRSGESTGATAAPPTCPGQVLDGSDVAVLGDVLIELTSFTADFEQQATNSGLLASGDHVRDYASALHSLLADGAFSVTTQYASALADGPARVVIMDGGATDVLNTPCGPNPSEDCPAIQAAVAGAELLFSQFAAGGVSHVFYAYYADPVNNPDLKAGIDVLRPLLENVCGKAPVACDFIDLRSRFAGHPEYLGADGLVWTDAGAEAAAEVVQAALSARCLAP